MTPNPPPQVSDGEDLGARLREMAEAIRLYDGGPSAEEGYVYAAINRINETAERIAKLEAALRSAALTFRHYEALHRMKGTEDGIAKAEANANHAADIEALLTPQDQAEGSGR